MCFTVLLSCCPVVLFHMHNTDVLSFSLVPAAVLLAQERVKTDTASLAIREQLLLDKEHHATTSTDKAWARLKAEAAAMQEERQALRTEQETWYNEHNASKAVLKAEHNEKVAALTVLKEGKGGGSG